MQHSYGNGSGTPPDVERMITEVFESVRARIPGGAGATLVLFVALAAWLATGIYQVNPSEVGVVMRFGRVVEQTSPGLHWHLPWPIESVLKPPVTVVLKEELGFRTIDPGPPARYRPVLEEARMLTEDGNIVELDFIVQYRIRDPLTFLFKVRSPTETLRAAAESAMREVIGRTTIDEALTEGRLDVQNRAQELLQKVLDDYDSGLVVTTVKLQDVKPPGPVQDAFKDVINAEQDKERLINEAEGFANDILPKARGSAAQYVNEAEGYAESLLKDAQGAAQRFDLVRDAYAKAPEVTRKRMYLETMEAILPEVDKIVVGNEAAGRTLPLLQLPTPSASPAGSHRAAATSGAAGATASDAVGSPHAATAPFGTQGGMQ